MKRVLATAAATVLALVIAASPAAAGTQVGAIEPSGTRVGSVIDGTRVGAELDGTRVG